MEKLRKTAIDYFLVGLCQVLIGLLVGSLGFFLIEITYQGPYDSRLPFIMAMFVMGTVGIARISIQEGTEHAIIYSVLLGVVAFLAIMRFVEFRGEWASLTPFINIGILGVIWWSSHKLTRDCSFVENAGDVGAGLLQGMGLDSAQQNFDDNEHASAASVAEQEVTDESPGWWSRMLKRRRRPHAPGLWIVYFSIAALPLFGLGQTLIPEDEEESRRYAFQLLILYVASGLSLLMMTSFLGLRSYLRQRQISMPLGMAGIWLGIGVLLIGGLMVFSMLMPRPGQPWVVSETVSWLLTDDDKSTSENAVGADGNQEGDGPGEGAEAGELDGRGDPRGSDGQQPGDGESGDGTSQPGGSMSGGGQPGDQDGGAEGGEQGEGGEGEDPNSAGSKEGDQGESGGDGSESQLDLTDLLPKHIADQMPMIAKILAWLALIVITLIVLWRHGKQLWQALLEILRGLAGLFGFSWGRATQEKQGSVAESAPAPPPRPFSDFPDPFSSGEAGSWTDRRLVYYSFHALEAWAREVGHARSLHETPIEFVQLLRAHRRDLTTDVGQLGVLYSRANYAPGTLPTGCVEQMHSFWNHLPALSLLTSEEPDATG
jgi:hypothetical protein